MLRNSQKNGSNTINNLKISELLDLGEEYQKEDKHLVSIQFTAKVKNEKKTRERERERAEVGVPQLVNLA